MSFDLVFFGGTGDLTWRKLMPALFQAFRHGKLPAGGRVLALARDEHSDDGYRQWLAERFREVDDAKRPDGDEFERFARLLHYRRVDLSQPHDYVRLRDWLDTPADSRAGAADAVVLYLATGPQLFPVICEQLGAVGLNGPRVRVVLEKPLGHDLASAQQINRVVRSVFDESQALRIDHYLGKPAVQNLMALRFAQCPVRAAVAAREHRQHPDHARRGPGRGHARRLLRPLRRIARHDPEPCAAAADDGGDGTAGAPPRRRDPRREAQGAARAQAVHARDAARDVVRGQYRGGLALGQPVPGLPGRAARARGQPLRDLRRAAHRSAELALGRGAVLPAHGQAAGRPRARRSSSTSAPRRTASFPALRPRRTAWSSSCSPKTGSSCTCSRPRAAAEQEALSPVFLDLDFDKTFAANRVGAYERLLLDVIAGRPTCSCAATSRSRPGAGSSRCSRPGRATTRPTAARALTRPAPGARRRRARSSRATASAGPKSN